ncbi:MAG: transcriptional regulator [Euryarchaeota archaeon]|nr:transcriptional regulator [Euryarchaeota archaeon]
MDKARLLECVHSILRKAEFSVSDPRVVRSASFDLVARRGDLILVVKADASLDSVKREEGAEMRALAGCLNGKALVVSTHSTGGKLADGVVFSRSGVPAMTPFTLSDMFLEGVPPCVFAAPGGFFVRLDGNALRKSRSERFSIKELAEAAGVSRKAIQMYEEGMGAMLDAALRLEDFLNTGLIVPIDPFSLSSDAPEVQAQSPRASGLEREVCTTLGELGYDVVLTPKCPFDALTKERAQSYLATIGRRNPHLVLRARATDSIARVAGQGSVVFTDIRGKEDVIGGTPIISKKELLGMGRPKDLQNLINERKRRSR